MRNRVSSGGVTINAIAGTHVVALGLDLSEASREDSLGFAIQREDHTEGERTWMRGMKTFAKTDPGLGPGGTASSREHPFQAFQWADYAAKPSHDYTYRVTPLYGRPEALEERGTASVRVTTETELGPRHSIFFNRGAVASQEYARHFQNRAPDRLEGPAQEAAYRWLSRGLLEALLAFIRRADGADYELYAAVYELRWPRVLDTLRDVAASGASVRVLYDGIPGDRKPGAKNLDAIQQAGIEGLCAPRTSGTLMHNKFFVLVDRGRPTAVWTGSTNLTENGLFGHLNCGHVVEGETVAQAFLDYWGELGTNPDAKAEKAWMAGRNPSPPDPWSEDVTCVFSPHTGLGVLDWYRDIAASATEALFMTFAFGMDERFQEVYKREDEVLRIALMDKEGSGSGLARGRKEIGRLRRRPNVVVAVGRQIKVNSFDRWLAERSGLTSNVQWVHTKFMLVDPLSTSPIVVGGSANFSENSTKVNNENMLIVRGDTRCADIYLGEFMRVYSHHAFREAVAIAAERHELWQPQHLDPTGGWQAEHFELGNDRFLRRRYFARAE